MLAWLGELIDRTCPAPPVLVGASLGASIAARFAVAHPRAGRGLVLVGTGGLVGKVRIPPATMLALLRHGARPSERTAMAMLRQVAVDPERVRRLMGERWAAFRAYTLELARTPSVRAGQPPPAARARTTADPARGAGPDRGADQRSSGGGGTG